MLLSAICSAVIVRLTVLIMFKAAERKQKVV